MPNNHTPYVDASSTGTIWTGTFQGVPNNGQILASVSTAGNRFNMIGNLILPNISAEAFMGTNSGNIEGALYFWRRRNDIAGAGNTSTFYATYTRAGGAGTEPSGTDAASQIPNGFIQVGQGFLVKAKSGATNVLFSNDYRVSDNLKINFSERNLLQSVTEYGLTYQLRREKHSVRLS